MGGGSGVVTTIGNDDGPGDGSVIRNRRGADRRTGSGAVERPPDLDAAAPDSADLFSLWVDPHWRGMSVLARRLTPSTEWEDVLQDALAAAWRKRRQFDPGRGTARNWLLAITADQASKHRRRRIPEPAEPHHDPAAPATDPGGDIDLDRAMSALTRRQRLCVTLYYFLGLPIADIAVVMACSEGTVKSTLRDSRTRMRGLLGEDYR